MVSQKRERLANFNNAEVTVNGITTSVRSWKTLKLKYEGIKKTMKMKSSLQRQEMYKTGGWRLSVKMTVILYDHCDLEERPSKYLRIWKAWHIILYVLIAVCGILNYSFLESSRQSIDDRCYLFPRELAFHMVELEEPHERLNLHIKNNNRNETADTELKDRVKDGNQTAQITDAQNSADNTDSAQNVESDIVKDQDVIPRDKREVILRNSTGDFETTIELDNVTVVIENRTHRLMLDTFRSFFLSDNDCQFAEYMPILSSTFAIVWLTLFVMCPRGGKSRTGITEPWRILSPALIFAVLLVGLTGHSFTLTNRGIDSFCAAFVNYTNATTCSPVDQLLQSSWNATWPFSARAAATRAAAAGVWAGWACAAALLVSRCLTAADFVVRRTQVYVKRDPHQNATWPFSARAAATRAAAAGVWAGWACAAALLVSRCLTAADFVVRRTQVYVKRDPHQKVLPHLLKSPILSTQTSSPSRRATPLSPVTSVKSEPTITTQLVTASVEHGPESAPSSLVTTPVRDSRSAEMLEMAHSPKEFQIVSER
ncbi:unnamed protein product [Plutella xylostella]|uniref:(diamondback moth) hypothetical protein n=1 Tax=Plutella xylostella TaxID=51655 RepID=A0A8S4FTB5_PLUXY|nr:unnamed protein product [Plutella xylostella]